jgi:hypothetical protein
VAEVESGSVFLGLVAVLVVAVGIHRSSSSNSSGRSRSSIVVRKSAWYYSIEVRVAFLGDAVVI